MYDLQIIGGGAAGLSAAINAASEGLKVVVLDKTALGGQAGSSSLIENFTGFPDGISGRELMERSIQQAAKFGTEFLVPFNVASLSAKDGIWQSISDDSEIIESRVALLAMGVSYRCLSAKGVSRFIGCGVSYGSPSLSESIHDENIFIVGGANSAGQAASYLADKGKKVTMLLRSDSIQKDMSEYLIEKINKHPNITVLPNTSVIEVKGDIRVKSLVLMEGDNVNEVPADRLYIMIGAKPKIAFLNGLVKIDESGYVQADLGMQTSIPGLFAAGDIRSGSVKRVAAAVGEGASAVSNIHKYLAQLRTVLQ